MTERDPALEPFERSHNDHAFRGPGEVAETPGAWRDDLKATYRRRD